MGTKRYELTDSEWSRIKEMLPPEHPKEGKRGRPAKCDNRRAMNGILWIARGGAPWRELPERYGPWQTVYSRFRKWRDMGERSFRLCLQTMTSRISLSTQHPARCIKAPTVEKKSENKAIGVSRGGRNTKIHTWVEAWQSACFSAQFRQ